MNYKLRAAWDGAATSERVYHHLVPTSVPNIRGSYPALAEVRCSPKLKSVYVLGAKVLEIPHLEDNSDYYLQLARDEAIKTLHEWGIDVEEEVRC